MKDLDCINTCDHKVGDIIFTLDACPKCKGAGEYPDISIDITGDLTTTSGSPRLSRDIIKVLREQLGTHIEDGAWGSDLYLVSPAGGATLTKSRITASVINAVTHLYELQSAEKSNTNGVLNTEIISQIKNLTLSSNALDPRKVELLLDIVAKSFDNVNVNIPIGK